MEFTCIGFDIRRWPWNTGFFCDETGWDTDEEVYEEIINSFLIKENEYQLLQIPNTETLKEICTYIKRKPSVNLIALEVPTKTVAALDTKHGFTTSKNTIDLSEFIFRGYDICDINGLFSALHHPELKKLVNGIISTDQYDHAIELVSKANSLDPNHAPNVVAKIYTLK